MTTVFIFVQFWRLGVFLPPWLPRTAPTLCSRDLLVYRLTTVFYKRLSSTLTQTVLSYVIAQICTYYFSNPVSFLCRLRTSYRRPTFVLLYLYFCPISVVICAHFDWYTTFFSLHDVLKNDIVFVFLWAHSAMWSAFILDSLIQECVTFSNVVAAFWSKMVSFTDL